MKRHGSFDLFIRHGMSPSDHEFSHLVDIRHLPDDRGPAIHGQGRGHHHAELVGSGLGVLDKLLTPWASRTEGEADQNDDFSEHAHDSHGLLLLYGAMESQLKTSVSA
jgi:hypothetical protein